MTAAQPQASERYLELVKKFALIEIRDDEHLEQANAVLHELLDASVGPDEQAYIDVLATLIESYETSRFGEPSARPDELLDLLLSTNQLAVDKVAGEIGVEPAELTALRRGERPFGHEVATRLADYFAVDPKAFAPEQTNEASAARSTGSPLQDRGMEIPYNKKSTTFRTRARQALKGWSPADRLVFTIGDAQGYAGSEIVRIDPSNPHVFDAETYESNDPTFFPARIKAVATELFHFKMFGRYRIAHDPNTGNVTVERLDDAS